MVWLRCRWLRQRQCVMGRVFQLWTMYLRLCKTWMPSSLEQCGWQVIKCHCMKCSFANTVIPQGVHGWSLRTTEGGRGAYFLCDVRMIVSSFSLLAVRVEIFWAVIMISHGGALSIMKRSALGIVGWLRWNFPLIRSSSLYLITVASWRRRKISSVGVGWATGVECSSGTMQSFPSRRHPYVQSLAYRIQSLDMISRIIHMRSNDVGPSWPCSLRLNWNILWTWYSLLVVTVTTEKHFGTYFLNSIMQSLCFVFQWLLGTVLLRFPVWIWVGVLSSLISFAGCHMFEALNHWHHLVLNHFGLQFRLQGGFGCKHQVVDHN